MSIPTIRRLLLCLTVVAFSTGCAGLAPRKPFFAGNPPPSLPPPGPEPSTNLEPATPKKPSTFWKGDGVKGSPQIVIKLGEQRGYFYRGKTAVGVTRVSTGKAGFATPVGSYRVIQKDKDHASNLYGDFIGEDGSVVKSNVDTSKDRPPTGASFRGAKMPYFLRFHGGYGLHAGRVPNYPASHGCVRLPAAMAQHFFENAELGTPVRIEN